MRESLLKVFRLAWVAVIAFLALVSAAGARELTIE
jgi:hypothetical protein